MLMLLACDLGAPPHPDDHEKVVFDVPEGATSAGLADELAAQGLVGAEWKWRWFLRLGADGSCIKAGRHELRRDMAAEELLRALCSAPIPTNEPFTVVEGWRLREIDAALAEKGWARPGELIALAQSPERFSAAFPLPQDTLEGYLFPETYMVDPTQFDLRAFVQRQLDTFGERFGKSYAGTRPLGEVVIMASMIEREEPTAAQRPLVAGILWKRIDNHWNLGVDATSRYTLPDWNDRQAFLLKLRDPEDPYNTRLRPGLPPHPIGSPGRTALEAAANPTPSEYWYYLHDAQQVLHPARDVGEHEANRRRHNVY